MGKCIYCGTPLEEDAIFCSYCGKKIESHICPNCGTEIEDGSIFCSKCGMRLQVAPEKNLPHKTDKQEAEIHPKKKYYLWYVACCLGVALLFLSGLYAFKYFKSISDKEINTSVTYDSSNKYLSLIGDADGFPLELKLNILNGDVSGIYKNVQYGTTMTVSGTMVDNVFNLEGQADNTNYIFQFVAEGENYAGTFGKVGGKRMKLHLTKYSDSSALENSNLNNKVYIYNAYKKALDDIYYSQEFEKDENGELVWGWINYFLYDITGDGIPELWITYGESEAGHQLRVCTYDKANTYKIIYEVSADHSGFYEGNGYIIKKWATMGEASWTKLTFNGKKIVEKIIFEEDVNIIDDKGNCIGYREYKNPKEKYIEFISFRNIKPIKQTLEIE